MYDTDFAGARNVFLRIGTGRIHLYDQPPKTLGQGTVHHVGIQTDQLETLVQRLHGLGVSVTDIRRRPTADYAMAQGPDELLIEIFQPNPDTIPPETPRLLRRIRMTVITVNTVKDRLSREQRRTLAETLTDAVLVPEVGQHAPAARPGFRVHFVEREPDMIAIGGRLLADAQPHPDVMLIDIAVMDADWRQDVRAEVIERILTAMAEACGLQKPAPGWWVNFRVIDEGSWGADGGVLSIHSLLDSGVFTEEKTKAIRARLSTAT